MNDILIWNLFVGITTYKSFIDILQTNLVEVRRVLDEL